MCPGSGHLGWDIDLGDIISFTTVGHVGSSSFVDHLVSMIDESFLISFVEFFLFSVFFRKWLALDSDTRPVLFVFD